ncbi:MAG TPA: hypothetical protein VMU83_08785 [Hanamia sp.]|nr:hypothetical protein [Hanamia sp.]
MPQEGTISKENKSADMQEIEMKKLREAISRTDTEKFFLFTRLMKIHFMLKNARIVKK